MTMDQQKKPERTEDGEPSTAQAEKKVQDEGQKEQQPEVQDVSTLETAEASSNAGTSETPMQPW